ncbi:putative RING-type domain-containing protein [Seiridium cardinale]|uniref:RING-type domain-containing protein n=1 Tax=Seiridium cardinale TaxID=138064 RepID=A0ABR2X8U3_9PEZI
MMNFFFPAAAGATLSKNNTLIIGIDFGTTFTGVAYGTTFDPDHRTLITSWPASTAVGATRSSAKVPTKIRILRDGEVQWGYQIPADTHPDEVIEWFKLGLDPDHIPGDAQNVKAKLAAFDVDDLVSRYLDNLGAHVMRTIEERYSKDVMKTMPTIFVLTVPAIWSDLAKQRTHRAFDKALSFRSYGPVESVSLLSEPEAAATFALDALISSDLQVGQTIVVVDAGGGTVDLVSYTINALGPVLEVSEAAPGSGGMCGSAYLDERFKEFYRAKLGQEPGFDNEILEEATETFCDMIKRQFAMAALPNSTYTVRCNGIATNPALGVRAGRMVLRAVDVHVIFEPVILQVIKLINEQIAATAVPVHGILLVGGFGQSIYLRERIEQAMQTRPAIKVMQSRDAWTAVAQGALMRGLYQANPERPTRVRVVDRRARKHYGTELSVVYHQEVHQSVENKRYWDGLDGCFRVDAMDWFIKRGERVDDITSHRKEVRQTSQVKFGRPQSILLTIYANEKDEQAPLTMNDNTKVLCHVEANLSGIPAGQLPIRRGEDGIDYYDIDCIIETKYAEILFRSSSSPPLAEDIANNAILNNQNELNGHESQSLNRNAGDRECTACLETKASDEFPSRQTTRSQLASNVWHEIRCPECPETLGVDDIGPYTDADTATQYAEYSMNRILGDAKGFAWCPLGCSSGQVHYPGVTQPVVLCQSCNRLWCFRHRVEWHTDYSCEEYESYLADPGNFRSQIQVQRDLEAAQDEWDRQIERQIEEAEYRFNQIILVEQDAAQERWRFEEAQRERERAEAEERARQEEERRRAEELERERARREVQAQQGEETAQRLTKPCPSCGVRIQKDGGW